MISIVMFCKQGLTPSQALFVSPFRIQLLDFADLLTSRLALPILRHLFHL